MAAGFPQGEWSKREQAGTTMSFLTYPRSHTLSFPLYPLSYTSHLCPVGEEGSKPLWPSLSSSVNGPTWLSEINREEALGKLFRKWRGCSECQGFSNSECITSENLLLNPTLLFNRSSQGKQGWICQRMKKTYLRFLSGVVMPGTIFLELRNRVGGRPLSADRALPLFSPNVGGETEGTLLLDAVKAQEIDYPTEAPTSSVLLTDLTPGPALPLWLNERMNVPRRGDGCFKLSLHLGVCACAVGTLVLQAAVTVWQELSCCFCFHWSLVGVTFT